MVSAGREEIESFRTLIARRLGLHFDDEKHDFLADVLEQQAIVAGPGGRRGYVQLLSASPMRSDVVRALVEQLTVNETFFFRNSDNFRALSERVLPERIRQMSQRKRLRILSAGCASGEEAYSIAIALREALPELAAWEIEILAVDLSAAMISKATRGRYSSWSLRATTDEVRRRYFQTAGGDFILDPEIRAMVTFEELNLLDDDPSLWRPESFDVVFLRNVIMYFTPEAMRETVQRVERALAPGGFLFLGHAETLRGLSQDFHLCHTHDTFYYQRRGLASVSSRPSSASNPPVASSELQGVLAGGASWIDAIQQASERIAELAEDPAARSTDDGSSPRAYSLPYVRSLDLGLVLEAMRQERFDDALELLKALPAEANLEPDALLLRAVLLANSGKLADAEAACSRLLALDELNAGAHYVMALCREHAADPAGALEHDQTAMYLDAGFAMPHLHRGLMARRARDEATARYELSQALVLLEREDSSRLLLFGGGFSREALVMLCRTELRSLGGSP